jgi:hypothetical protein
VLVVVAFDGDDGNARLFNICRPMMAWFIACGSTLRELKKSPQMSTKSTRIRQRVAHDHVAPRTEEVSRALFHVIASATEMNVCEMKKFHNNHKRMRTGCLPNTSSAAKLTRFQVVIIHGRGHRLESSQNSFCLDGPLTSGL